MCTCSYVHVLVCSCVRLCVCEKECVCHRKGLGDACKPLQKALSHIATHCCNTLQHIATHCKTLQHTAWRMRAYPLQRHAATHHNILQHTVTRCNTLQQTATRNACILLQDTVQHTAKSLQHSATHCYEDVCIPLQSLSSPLCDM